MMLETDRTSPERSEVVQNAAREKKCLEENREAFECWNKYVEENGLTLERFHMF